MDGLSPASLVWIMGGALIVGAAGLAAFFDWQERQEKAAARHALAYYDTWADADLIRDDDGVVLHNQPTTFTADEIAQPIIDRLDEKAGRDKEAR